MFGLMIVATLFLWTQGTETSRFCTYSNETHISEDVADILHHNEERRNQKVECPRETRSCYTFWRMENTKPNGTLIVIIYQGCWEASGINDCSVGVCNPLPSKKELRRNGFCCCIGNFCNGNINFTTIKVDDNAEDTDSDVILQGKPDIHKDKNEEDAVTGCNERKAIVLGGCAGLVMVLIVISVLLSRRWSAPTSTKNKASQDHRLFRMSPDKSVQDVNNTYSVTHLNLDRVVGQGRYSTVWLGKVKDHQVAVKMFPIHKSNYFYNEKDIYSLPFMQHPSFLTYFGCDEIKRKDGDGRLVLVLSYCPLGNLQEYLRKHTLDLMTFTKMALSISTGLAYLHTEIHKQGKWKPCVTHRDINTRNILVKDDLSCCIADLGLAVKITGCHYYTLGEEQHAEAKSINDVGTLRYMAPEVLEGAVNLRDCESSLKQIDVYALGLVLWELSTRVVDFYNKASDVPDYALPFEKEIGLHPTLEDMQILVCRNKARPLFPLEWINTLATRTMRETVEDCTDQDGEARLTALCVQERISQICRGSSQIGSVSPMVNQTGFLYQNSNYDNYNNLESTDIFTGEKEMVDGGVSEGTVETMVTMSPSESLTTNVNTFTKDLWGAVQPYQGRNPCLERNLLCSESSDEVFVVETSRKHGKVVGETTSIVPTAVALPLYSGMSTLQKRGFTTPKQVNTDASKMQPKQNKDDYNALLTRVIVSPFENALVVNGSNNVNAIRPSSLDVLTTSYNSVAQDDEEDSKRLKELSGRIRTPGDLPPSVRRTRGSRQAARLSLYDDRIMTCSRLIDTTF